MEGSASKEKYVGRRVYRVFDGQGICGTVADQRDAAGVRLWKVAYDDGDAEDLDRRDLLRAMDLFQEKRARERRDRSYVGRRVARRFGSHVCRGTVAGFVARDPCWRVRYDWGASDALGRRELLRALDLFDEEGDATPPVADPEVRRGRHRHKRQRNSGDGVQLFAFDGKDRAAQRECGEGRPRRTLKEVQRFDPSSCDAEALARCPAGHGFACPRCSAACSYDAQRCDACRLACCYEPGVGALVVKEREVGRATGGPRRGSAAAAAAERRKSVEDVTDARMCERRQKLLDSAIVLD